MKTTTEQLDEVQEAISKVMTGQSGSWGDKTVSFADLAALTARENSLLERLSTESRGGLTRNVGVIRRA